MAQGFLQSLDDELVVASAGTQASGKLNTRAVAVMAEKGIDISKHSSDQVEMYLGEEWDYVITVCGGANETCPVFEGRVTNRLHIGVEDPSDVVGTDEFIWSEFRRVRDMIALEFKNLYENTLKPQK